MVDRNHIVRILAVSAGLSVAWVAGLTAGPPSAVAQESSEGEVENGESEQGEAVSEGADSKVNPAAAETGASSEEKSKSSEGPALPEGAGEEFAGELET